MSESMQFVRAACHWEEGLRALPRIRNIVLKLSSALLVRSFEVAVSSMAFRYDIRFEEWLKGEAIGSEPWGNCDACREGGPKWCWQSVPIEGKVNAWVKSARFVGVGEQTKASNCCVNGNVSKHHNNGSNNVRGEKLQEVA